MTVTVMVKGKSHRAINEEQKKIRIDNGKGDRDKGASVCLSAWRGLGM